MKNIKASEIMLILTFLFVTVEGFSINEEGPCELPLEIDCPPLDYCGSADTIIGKPGTSFKCDQPLNLSAQNIILEEGTYSSVNIEGQKVQIQNLTILGNLTIAYYEGIINGTNQIQNLLFAFDKNPITTNASNSLIIEGTLTAKSVYIRNENLVQMSNLVLITNDDFCFQQLIPVSQLTSIPFIDWENNYTELFSHPFTLLIFAGNYLLFENLNITTTNIALYSYGNFTSSQSIVNTSAYSCRTNTGMGKGLEIQMSSDEYCSSGGSSSGYGVTSQYNCRSIVQYFMFLTHSLPYLSKMPYVGTGSGGYGYIENEGNFGSGGGIIFILVNKTITTNHSMFLTNGGVSGGNGFISSGSGGTLLMYSQILTGQMTNFSSSGGASYNVNGSGGGGVIKISFDSLFEFTEKSMWVNTSSGYQHQEKQYFQGTNGLNYGTICPSGKFISYIKCNLCPAGTFSTMGDQSCQKCPQASGYEINESAFGNTQISQCFTESEPTFYQIWFSPFEINEYYIIAYLITLLITFIIGVVLKKKFKKKLSIMETEDFSLEDVKKSIEQTRMITEKLKGEKNIKFEDLMYHVHRITLHGINSPNCPWILPHHPPEEIQKYILVHGYMDFTERFNKIARWEQKERILLKVLGLFYPFYWFYYDYCKKKKYNKLVSLLEESKEFNLVNNYDFEDQNMVTIKISKNTDYTICYLDFLLYQRADLKFFNLASPFIISLSGEGNFLRPFYLQDNDVFFNSLFMIMNRNLEKVDDTTDEKAKLFSNLVTQKKRQENNNKLIGFLKTFNQISISLDLSAPTSTFIKELIELIEFIGHSNVSFFTSLNIQIDLILMVSEFKKDVIVFDEVHILTNRNNEVFEKYLNEVIESIKQKQNIDFKLGLFVYNPDQQIEEENKKNSNQGRFSKLSWGAMSEPSFEEESMKEQFIQSQRSLQNEEEKDSQSVLKSIKRGITLLRYFLFCHRSCRIDQFEAKFYLSVLVLFQCLIVWIWAIRLQFPYVFINLVSPYIGILWLVSDSYGFAKLYLILNSLAMIDEIVTLILYTSLGLTNNYVKTIILQTVNIGLGISVIALGTRVITVSEKLSVSKMFK